MEPWVIVFPTSVLGDWLCLFASSASFARHWQTSTQQANCYSVCKQTKMFLIPIKNVFDPNKKYFCLL